MQVIKITVLKCRTHSFGEELLDQLKVLLFCFDHFYLWNTGLITEISKSVLQSKQHRNPTNLDLFCSQRFGNRSGDRFGNRFGNRFDGAASFLTCLGSKTVWFFLLQCLNPKGVVPQVQLSQKKIWYKELWNGKLNMYTDS